MSPTPHTEDYYAILRVGQDADPAEITRAYQRLAHELHPDRDLSVATKTAFQRIQGAYHVLSFDEERRKYDAIYPTIEKEPWRPLIPPESAEPTRLKLRWDPNVNSAEQIRYIWQRRFERASNWNKRKGILHALSLRTEQRIQRHREAVAELEVTLRDFEAYFQSDFYRKVLAPNELEEEKERKDRLRQDRQTEKSRTERLIVELQEGIKEIRQSIEDSRAKFREENRRDQVEIDWLYRTAVDRQRRWGRQKYALAKRAESERAQREQEAMVKEMRRIEERERKHENDLHFRLNFRRRKVIQEAEEAQGQRRREEEAAGLRRSEQERNRAVLKEELRLLIGTDAAYTDFVNELASGDYDVPTMQLEVGERLHRSCINANGTWMIRTVRRGASKRCPVCMECFRGYWECNSCGRNVCFFCLREFDPRPSWRP